MSSAIQRKGPIQPEEILDLGIQSEGDVNSPKRRLSTLKNKTAEAKKQKENQNVNEKDEEEEDKKKEESEEEDKKKEESEEESEEKSEKEAKDSKGAHKKKRQLKELQEDLDLEKEEDETYQDFLNKTASELKELILISPWNNKALKYALTPDPVTENLERTKLLLIEPRSAKQLKDDGGFHFDWIDNFIVSKSKNGSSGIVAILVRNDSKNLLVPLVDQYLDEEKNWEVHSIVIIKDRNPRKNAVFRSKNFQFTSAKQLLYIVVQKGSKVSICKQLINCFSYLNQIQSQLISIGCLIFGKWICLLLDNLLAK